MKTTFTRTITITAVAASHNAPLDTCSLRELKEDSFRRLQRELGTLMDERFGSGSFSYQDRHPCVSLNWTITVQDHPDNFEVNRQSLS